MKRIFIAYSDENCAYSLRRIGSQAKSSGLFDEVLLYTPETLPEYIKASPLMKYSYGGGYWAWKPCILYETLQRYNEGDVVCYVDAGCTLKARPEWGMFFDLMREYDFLCFRYRDIYPEWEKFGSKSTKIKHWGKKATLLFLDEYCGSDSWRERNKIWGGFIMCRGKSNPVVKDWLDISLKHPEVIMDPSEDEMRDQYPFFARHKHDQALLVALTEKYKDKCLVLPEISETCGENVFIYASRIRAKSFNEYCLLRLKYYIRRLVGDKVVDRLKHLYVRCFRKDD
ncbi:MAG: hypothetical protein PUA96_09135 [Bacteroidales bacterium]|nr:hypothetical protein [Bacteroidales bacterium]